MDRIKRSKTQSTKILDILNSITKNPWFRYLASVFIFVVAFAYFDMAKTAILLFLIMPNSINTLQAIIFLVFIFSVLASFVIYIAHLFQEKFWFVSYLMSSLFVIIIVFLLLIQIMPIPDKLWFTFKDDVPNTNSSNNIDLICYPDLNLTNFIKNSNMVCELIESIPAGKDYFVTLRFNSNENISFVAYSTFIKTNSSKRIVSIGPLRSDGDFVIAAQLSDKNYGSLVSSIFTNQKTIIYSEKNILFKSISEKAPLFIASIIFVLTSMSGAFINIRKLYEGK